MIPLIFGIIGYFLLTPIIPNSSIYAAVIINELYPKTEPATGEWIELYNTGSESVSLDRWKVQHAAGNASSFILNASSIIQPHGFLTLTGSQTAINFYIEGDTVLLFDVGNNQVDSQSYPGILGYNTSMGRSIDGAGSWVLCTTPTFNTANNCPQPSPLPTNTPTIPATPYPTTKPLPTSTPIPSPKNIPIPSPVQQTFGLLLTSPPKTQVLGITHQISPTTSPAQDVLYLVISKSRVAYVLLGIAAATIILMFTLLLRRRRRVP